MALSFTGFYVKLLKGPDRVPAFESAPLALSHEYMEIRFIHFSLKDFIVCAHTFCRNDNQLTASGTTYSKVTLRLRNHGTSSHELTPAPLVLSLTHSNESVPRTRGDSLTQTSGSGASGLSGGRGSDRIPGCGIRSFVRLREGKDPGKLWGEHVGVLRKGMRSSGININTRSY
jgi:hypothetical protein